MASEETGQTSMSHISERLAGRTAGIMAQAPQRRTAVVVPLVREDDGVKVLFTRRALTLRRQPGEISFPGGHAEPGDVDAQDTAIREASEELGVPRAQIRCIAPLDVLVGWSGLVVHPFVVEVPLMHVLSPNPDEVDEVFSARLDELLALTPEIHEVPLKPMPLDDFPFHLIAGGRDYAWRSGTVRQWFYEVEGRVVWGLTARILSHFLDVVRGL